jgi:hypothetical protein
MTVSGYRRRFNEQHKQCRCGQIRGNIEIEFLGGKSLMRQEQGVKTRLFLHGFFYAEKLSRHPALDRDQIEDLMLLEVIIKLYTKFMLCLFYYF